MSETLPEVPFGAWPSPITASRLVEGAAAVGEVRVDGTDVWWAEQRPSEGGRYQLVRCASDGSRHDLFPAWSADGGAGNWNARTAVLEYGGGAWAVRSGVVVFANWADQRLYRVDPGGAPEAITPEPTVARGLRWSEVSWLDDRWLVCVRESHEPDVVAAHGEATDEVVALPLDGSAVDDPSLVRVLVSGPDFVHTPAVAGDRVAWVQWDHPRMPWDGTELVTGSVARDRDGRPVGIVGSVVVAGGPGESVVQPGFTRAGDLVFCTDRTGWWNPWRLPAATFDDVGAESAQILRQRARADISVEPVLADGGVDAEIGGPLWVGGERWWAELADGRLLVSATADGTDRLAVVETDGAFVPLDTAFTLVSQVVAGPADAGGPTSVVVAGSPVGEAAPYALDLRGSTPMLTELRPPRDLGIGTEWFARPRHVTFESVEGRTAHALHYPPQNPTVTAPAGQAPPLVVMIHGGPTSAARHRLDLAKQFWTTRGFAVVDVNHGGSTGYGRPFRRLLDGRWGVVDVEDAVAAARHLADEGLADPERLAIRGGSAGGYTTLAALCFHDTFAAGASHYGIADLSALATDTHKFESRYLDGLVGPWPEARATYEARSPIHHTDGFAAPLIVLQGSEDEVVPPNQAEMIVAALADKAIPHAYLLFEGEQHGFRQAANIVRALEAELWFYGRVFGFDPADPIDPVDGAVGL
jgi:dipeptidyl aminopeptidase/acylaminoacyl peptidase